MVILCLRYLLEQLDEAEILAIDAEGEVANAGVTEYAFDASIGVHGGIKLQRYNFTASMEREGIPVTAEADAGAVARRTISMRHCCAR